MKNNLILLALLTLLLSSGKKDFYKVPKDFAFIPMGTTTYNGNTISVDAFIMQKTEVTNKQYREFLNSLKKNKELKKLKIAQIDTVKWRQDGKYNEPYVNFYHKHPAYDNYPVVNITREAAELYCEWLSQKWKKENNQNIQFRLPTEYEWIYAAKAGTNKKFPWEENSLINKKGDPKCNYKHIEQHKIREYKDGKIKIFNDESAEEKTVKTILAPVDSYEANEFELYNMSGNAAEMVAEKNVIKGGSWNSTGYYMMIESESEYTEEDIPSPYVGFRVIYTIMPENNQ